MWNPWVIAALSAMAAAQLTGHVGPLTSVAEKAAIKTCNVLDYGAVADNSTDVGQPIADAFADCSSGGLVYVPEGNYAMQTWVSLADGVGWALQIDGVIYRAANPSSQSYMIEISGGSDFELFSSTSAGAIQGSGYLYHMQGTAIGPRLLHVSAVSDWSVHDFLLVDAPMFHFVIQGGINGEIYNMAIRGGNEGGLDGIDVSGTNIWIHDVMVTNKDECVTVKNDSTNLLIEDIYCNWSGGCAIGSLSLGANVSNIVYSNIYTWSSNQMMMIKSNEGSGTVSNVVFENFIGHGNAYSLDIDSYWASMSSSGGEGIEISNLTIRNWKGTEANGEQRGPIKVLCPEGNPCYDITIEDFAMWSEWNYGQWYSCGSAYGDGFCLDNSTDPDSYTSYAATTTTVWTAPSGYSAATMPDDLATAFGLTAPIPIPTLPASFFPGVTPISPFAGASAQATPSSSSRTVVSITPSSLVSHLLMASPSTTTSPMTSSSSSYISTAERSGVNKAENPTKDHHHHHMHSCQRHGQCH
ncbi:uncharacterized protein N7496_007469 [Penicillium cataractarum]|uniref:Rhamnogalacturonase A/B/Epimerase-like pectate lyase domain-containing protein n=1 Tax=Penicillium cataractarum TaxID=2100454 RepID=A0A9W9S3G8_9EURO|nr:uncharacterized protein N7496_007469 [Penicillium cataractarum]KAJ5371377.1 hypothetical protein N7496_007469 [Penicillium cataractarum]